MPPVHWTGFLRIASACAAWSIASGTRDGRMNTLRADAAPLTAAQITLLVLRATVRGAASARNGCTLPSGVRLAFDKAAHAPAPLRTAVQCADGMTAPVIR